MLLTDEEKRRFAEYLRAEIMSAEEILKATESASFPQIVKEQAMKRERMLILGCKIVLDRITSGEAYSIS